MNKKLTAKDKTALTILDQETGEFIEITEEQKVIASLIQRNIELGFFISAINIKKMLDGRYYYALGCQSRDEWIDTKCPIGRSQVYKLYAIATKFEPILDGMQIKQLGEGSSESTSDSVQLLDKTGVEKLYELSKLEDAQLNDLLKNGKIKTDGGEYSFDDIKDATAKEMSRIIAESTKKYKAKLSQQDEEIATLLEEKKIQDKELAKIRKDKKDLEDIEMLYGPVASTVQQKRKYMETARTMLEEFNEVLIRCGVTADDPETMHKYMQGIIREIDEIHQRAIDTYKEVLEQ